MAETELWAAHVESYEGDCEERIAFWHSQLKVLAREAADLETLKTAIETELALADLKIKVRQADRARVFTWVPMLLPAGLAFAGAIIGALLH